MKKLSFKFQGGEGPPGGEGAPIYKFLSQLLFVNI